ncbi:hypothetical protein ES705_37485 [subsurface metagenome]
MKNKKLVYGILVIVLISLLGVWLSLDDITKCRIVYHKNICYFYAMMDIANNNPAVSDFDEMMNLCKGMSDAPKKDGCFEYVALTFAQIDMGKAEEACDKIKEFGGVHSKENCYGRIYFDPKIEPTKEMVEKVFVYEKTKQPVNLLKSEPEKGDAIATLLTRKLHELNLQATCVFSEEDILKIKQNDRVAQLNFKTPIDITISQWIKPEERYHIPVDEKGYRILGNVETALFILEDNLDEGLEAHILVGHLIPPEPGLHDAIEKIGYSCWAINIKEEGKPELDKTWIDGINRIFIPRMVE